MSIGDGVFVSAVLLSIVGLYAATRDRWNWKRIAKWGLILPVPVLAIAGLGIWLYSAYDERPIAQESFVGLRLSSTPADVRFLKGEPIAEHSTEDQWVYHAHSGSGQPEDSVVIVRFLDGRVRYINYWANERQIVNPYLLGFTIGSEYDAVINKLRQPSHISVSADGLNRLLSFEKYNVAYEFERGKVTTYGIFDPATGPLKFSKEVETPAASAK